VIIIAAYLIFTFVVFDPLFILEVASWTNVERLFFAMGFIWFLLADLILMKLYIEFFKSRKGGDV
jgi:hypothetical protein